MRAKKSLGQNFIKSNAALRAMIRAGEVAPGETILEIGPGRGALTERLLASGARVTAVEKDEELCKSLRNKFTRAIEACSFVLVHGDILKFDPANLSRMSRTLPDTFNAGSRYKVIANIPYNITGAILEKLLTATRQPERIVLMVQKEVAQRIMEKKESLLSISVKTYGEPKVIMKVPASSFSPRPKVDSAIVVIKNISRNIFTENNVDEKMFWRLVRAGFAHKRKKLASNLRQFQDEYQGETLVRLAGLLGNKRAEELPLEDWIKLAKVLQ